jgi:hypothetical protein
MDADTPEILIPQQLKNSPKSGSFPTGLQECLYTDGCGISLPLVSYSTDFFSYED